MTSNALFKVGANLMSSLINIRQHLIEEEKSKHDLMFSLSVGKTFQDKDSKTKTDSKRIVFLFGIVVQVP